METPAPNQWNIDRIDEIVFPALQRLLKEGELDGVSIESDGPNLRMLWGRFCVRGERIRVLVSDSDITESLEEAKQRFYEQLQSEIAETTFAWGELRE
ncbi:hypothetical protein [Brevibacterium sp. FME37]|uniref:hypothetical protein n=1 Tax=Brevibacterium sp. FME37 TaxID=2742607 RepID=UPI0018672CF3|nr:hypothetical protein [Brevibacterium sp. FME37]